MAFGKERLNVASDQLNQVGQKLENVAYDVQDRYRQLTRTVETITSNESWHSAASEEFKNNFYNFDGEFKSSLEQLLNLGSKVKEIARGYEEAEANNMNRLRPE